MAYEKPEIQRLSALEVIQTHIGKDSDMIDSLTLRTRSNDPAYEADE
jgi:hypothetical protein